ncbi:hypothetical protein, partial [Mycobacterium tuberculosis]|uniref:hypothetical protein n=1 Tax=Mycobacterium tuberculosis TaxID=1773 RepID=UPI001F32DDE6
ESARLRSSASKSSSLIRPLGLIRNGVASTRRPAAVSLSTVAAALAGKEITVDGYEGEVRQGVLALSAWSESDTPELRELAD